jgi:hypothetical protein
VKVPETIKNEDAEGFAMGVEYILKKLESNPRQQNFVIQLLRDDSLLEILD